MVNNNNPGTTKRRKRRQSINFKTAREKRRAKSTHLPSSTTLNSVESHSLSEKSTISKAKGQKTVDNDRVNDDSSVSTATTSTIGHRDSRRNITALAATVSKVPTTENFILKEKLPVPGGGRRHQKISKPMDDVDEPTLGSTKEDISKSHPSSASVSSQAQTCLSNQQKQPRKRAHQTKSATQRLNNDSSLKSPKRLKTSKQSGDEASSSNNSITGRTGMAVKTRQRKNPGIPDRIKDFRVTKKAFGKWKPLAKSTTEFVGQILRSVVLNVTAYTSTKESQQAVKCLTMLKDRVLERFPTLKAPYTQGDYRKMESQNKGAEKTYLEKSRELNVLDQKLEEEQRLLQDQCTMVAEYTKKMELCKAELISLDNEKAHPLVRETKNVLDLPDLPENFFNEEEVPLRENSAEQIHLCQTLMKLREKANSTGLTTWMDKLANFTEDLGKTK